MIDNLTPQLCLAALAPESVIDAISGHERRPRGGSLNLPGLA